MSFRSFHMCAVLSVSNVDLLVLMIFHFVNRGGTKAKRRRDQKRIEHLIRKKTAALVEDLEEEAELVLGKYVMHQQTALCVNPRMMRKPA